MGVEGGPNIVTEGLVFAMDAGSERSFNTTDSTVAQSIVSNTVYTGSLIGGTSFSSDNEGSFVFDGSNDRIQVEYDSYWDQNVFGEATNFTISCWANADSFFNWTSLIHKAHNSGGWYSNTEGAGIWINSGGYQAVFGSGVQSNPSGWGSIISYITSDTGEWYNLTFTGDGTTGRFYVDGIQQGTMNLNARTVAVSTSTNGPTLGARAVDGAFYDGKATCYLFYDRGLTAAEVLQNFNAYKNRFDLL